jgi:hypothetical protein
MLDSLIVQAWVFVMLSRLRQSSYAEIALVIRDASPTLQKPPLWRRIVKHRRHLLYMVYRWLDSRVFRPRPNAFEPQDLGPLLDGVPVLDVLPCRTRYSDYFSADDLAAIKREDLDVIVRLGFRIIRGKILSAARAGVWSFHHGDADRFRGGPAGFWEVFLRAPTTGSVLQVLSEELYGGPILYSSQSATDFGSVARSLNGHYWKTLSFLPRALAELHRVGHVSFLANARRRQSAVYFYSHPMYTAPTNFRMARILLQLAGFLARRRLGRVLWRTQWCLLARESCSMSGSLNRFRAIVPPPDRFWADPCVIEHEGRTHIFIEEYMYAAAQGHIALLTVGENDTWPDKAEKVLERPYHLSYPFVFAWRGEFYMLVESHTNRTIEVFRAVEFPLRWEPAATLMEGLHAVDATLHEQDGRWWLFVNIVENDGASSSDELFLFHAAEPLSQNWVPHPQNPIVSDVRRSRPAGRLFLRDGYWIRPAQDCSHRYGSGIRFQQIVKLTETESEEREIGRIGPDWDKNILGIHTFNSAGGWTVCGKAAPRTPRHVGQRFHC